MMRTIRRFLTGVQDDRTRPPDEAARIDRILSLLRDAGTDPAFDGGEAAALARLRAGVGSRIGGLAPEAAMRPGPASMRATWAFGAMAGLTLVAGLSVGIIDARATAAYASDLPLFQTAPLPGLR